MTARELEIIELKKNYRKMIGSENSLSKGSCTRQKKVPLQFDAKLLIFTLCKNYKIFNDNILVTLPFIDNNCILFTSQMYFYKKSSISDESNNFGQTMAGKMIIKKQSYDTVIFC